MALQFTIIVSDPAAISCYYILNGANVSFPALHSGENVLSIPGVSITGYQSIACSNHSSNDVDLLVTQLAAISPVAPSPTPSPTPIPSPTPTPEAYELSLLSGSSVVAPLGTAGNSSTIITARLTSNSTSLSVAGKIITFRNIPESNSGGHLHPLDNRPIGAIFPNSCITGTNGSCSARYEAPEVGGIEQISAIVAGLSAANSPIAITTKVDGLYEIGNSNFYRLTGQTDSHQKNHFVAAGTDFIGLASDFLDAFNATLGINDASLPFGGLFDIGPPRGSFWSKPHSLHREGRSLDIDQCAESVISDNPNDQENCPNGWIKIDKIRFKRLCNAHEGFVINEPTLHCEF